MIPGMIGIDGETLINVNALLMKEHDGLPTRDEASDVVGTTQEHATAAFMSRLTKIADQLGDHTNVVRVTVADHVEIMKKAASSMQDNDDHNADWVKNQDTMFKDVASSTSKKDVTDAEKTVESENTGTPGTQGTPASTAATTPTTTAVKPNTGDM